MLPGMKAVVIAGAGGTEVLELREVPDPPFGPDDVRVRIQATAMNRADVLQRRGLYPAPPGAPPDIPGLEFAGRVEGCGERVRLLRPGDRVMAIVGGGAHAERISLPERLCLPVPARLTWEEAAAIPEAFATAFDALLLQGGLSAGEVVLVHAAASGVGSAAVQVAAAAGATVVALSRSADKRKRLEAMGAPHVLDPSADGLPDRIREALGGRGVDVVLELVGAASWAVDLEVLAERGRLVLVGTMGGARVDADLGVLMRKRLSVLGTVLRSRPVEEKIALSREFARRMIPLFEQGRLRAVVDRVLPLSRIAEAHERIEGNETFGKLVLRVGE